MKIHELKVHPNFFKDIAKGLKSFEIRKNNRNFQLGDRLLLKEYEPDFKRYTEKKLLFKITYILNDSNLGIKKGYCIMSIIPIPIKKKYRGMVVYTNTEIIDND